MVRNDENCDGYYFVRYQELLDKKKIDKIEATWEDLMNSPMPPCLCYIIFNEKATIHYTGKLQKYGGLSFYQKQSFLNLLTKFFQDKDCVVWNIFRTANICFQTRRYSV